MRPSSLALAAMAMAFVACGPTSAPSRTVTPPTVNGSASGSIPAPFVLAPSPDARLPRLVVPRSYGVHLAIDPRKARFSGDVRIVVDVKTTTSHVVLHGHDMHVTSARFVGKDGVARAAAVEIRFAKGAKEAKEELVLTFAAPLAVGEGELSLAFDAPFGTQLRGLYRVEDGGKWYAFTQFEAIDARRAFPCFDEPAFKVPFDVAVSVPKEMRAFANTRETGTTTEGDLVRHAFARTEPLPTYLLAFAVGELDVREGPLVGKTPTRLIATAGKAKLGALSLATTAKVLAALEGWFGRPYPYDKLDVVAVPDFGAGAMENAGLVTFREELLLLDEAKASTVSRRRMLAVVAHELAHQWFGNLVTMPWWDDIWLNEGFATWMQAKACDLVDPGFGAETELLAGKNWVMNADALPSASPVRMPVKDADQILEAGGWTAYTKGANVLAMLERWLGREAFQKGIREYLGAHAHGLVTSDDLLIALGKASGKDVRAVGASFLDRPGVPLVSLELSCKGGKGELALTQRRFLALPIEQTEGGPPFRIPVCVRVPKGKSTSIECTLLEGERGKLALDSCPAWVHPNAEAAGYYRAALAKGALEATLAHSKELLPVERLMLVSDAWALVTGGVIDAGAYFGVVAALSQESSRVVIEPLVATLEAANREVVDDAARPRLQAFVRKLLGPLHKKLGPPKPGEDEERRLLRRLTMGTLGELGHDPAVLAEAEKLTRAALAKNGGADPDLALMAVRLSSLSADEARLVALERALVEAKTPEERLFALVGLGSIGDPKLLRRALDRFLDGTVKAQDFRYLQGNATRRPASRAVFLAWVEEHFEAIRARLPGGGGLVFAAAGACTKEERVAAVAFFEPRAEKLDGARRALAEVVAGIDACIAVRGAQAASATAWLSKH
ncbi:MAG: ERAP1-like C-terminal domain-containing protein [Myxococcales bacterium]|nr:ERAP1-like C-terminal domain-containing protein [Myxococcales bacterium]